MAFCPNCGSEVTGSFCPNCGTAVSGATASGGAGLPPQTPPGAIAVPGLTQNVASALCYLGWFVTGIIFLVLSPYNTNRTIRFHAFQSIFATIAVIILRIILGLIVGMLFVVHSWWLGVLLYRVFNILVFIGWLYMMYTAYTNKKVKLPIIGDLAEKQA